MDELKIRIEEAIKIYRDTPNLTMTAIDMARTLEYILNLIEPKSKIGFENGNPTNNETMR